MTDLLLRAQEVPLEETRISRKLSGFMMMKKNQTCANYGHIFIRTLHIHVSMPIACSGSPLSGLLNPREDESIEVAIENVY